MLGLGLGLNSVGLGLGLGLNSVRLLRSRKHRGRSRIEGVSVLRLVVTVATTLAITLNALWGTRCDAMDCYTNLTALMSGLGSELVEGVRVGVGVGVGVESSSSTSIS